METLRYIVLVNALLAVVSGAFYVLLRRETFFGTNRLMLWLGLAATLLLPLLELPDWRPQPVRAVMHRTAQAIVPRVLPQAIVPPPDVTITFPNGETYPAFPGQEQAHWINWSWPLVLMLLYGTGVSCLLIRLSFQLLSLNKLIRQSTHEPYAEFTLVRNKQVDSPFSFFDWVVLNPNRYTPDALEQILRHERVHVREWHSVDMLAAELVCIVFWFNPAAYLFRHLLHQTLEFTADRRVLAEGVDAKSYQYNLVNVSLSAGQSPITNHFSKSQLKSRIGMLNKSNSPKTARLKYVALGIVALAVTVAFARPQLNTLPKPLTVALAPVGEPLKEIARSVKEQQPVVETKSFKPEIAESDMQQKPVIPVNSYVETKLETPDTDSTRVSPTRYILYKGDYLYWIVTPKTTFDDFALMKKEFEKHGNLMQLNELKYDPLYAYIDQISFTVKRLSGGFTNCEETDDDLKPIPTIAGYEGIGPKAKMSSGGGLRYYKDDFPESLRILATEEEKATDQFITAHKADYLMHEGAQKFKDLGFGERTYEKNYIRKNPTDNNSGLVVSADGSLSVNKKLGDIKLFVNNKAIGRAALSEIKVDQLSSVVEKMQFNPARKESFVSALLIYTNDDN